MPPELPGMHSVGGWAGREPVHLPHPAHPVTDLSLQNSSCSFLPKLPSPVGSFPFVRGGTELSVNYAPGPIVLPRIWQTRPPPQGAPAPVLATALFSQPGSSASNLPLPHRPNLGLPTCL